MIGPEKRTLRGNAEQSRYGSRAPDQRETSNG